MRIILKRRDIAAMLLALTALFLVPSAPDALAAVTNITFTVHLTVGNYPPTIDWIVTVPAQDPTEAANTTFYVWYNVSDPDGAGTINNNTAEVVINRSGVSLTAISCSNATINGTMQTINCTMEIEYYRNAGGWDINVSIRDISSAFANDTSNSFTYNMLSALWMNTTAISFGSVNIGQTNVAPNSSLVLNNTGNVDFTEVNITAYDLVGFTNPSYSIAADNFTVRLNASTLGGDVLDNVTNTTVTGATVPHGAPPASNESLWIYINQVPGGLISQDYNTTNSLDWWVLVG
ncbi:hypothetical protein JXB02_02770 [Candidatus Woesearchaeota archaeon]|nr:hypothetical protein [Candidatus Woesearchaeota archaeon]